MKSPFPGMDPYLERFWRSTHHSIITYAQEQLNEQLPGGLFALIDERVFVEPRAAPRNVYLDVYVAEYPASPAKSVSESGAVSLAEPILIRLSDEPATQAYLEIREAGTGNQVVTVIEFVSPTNKQPGEGRRLYLQKQEECLAGRVNLVEIDLVRGGPWVLSIPRDYVPPQCLAGYHACTRRGSQKFQAALYSFDLRQPLPGIAIPLRVTDADVSLDLQSLINQCFTRGRLGYGIDYNEPLDPPLDAADEAWADELLRAAGRRTVTKN